MKEIPFRWIDKYLIHLSIQQKFYLLFFLPILAMVILALMLNSAANSLVDRTLQEELQVMKGLIEVGQLSEQQVRSVLSGSESVKLGMGPDSIAVLDGKINLYASHHLNLWQGLSTTQVTLIVLCLSVIISVVYYIMTFIGGAMFAMNKALHTLAQGDLTHRMNYFKVRDEFSTIAITIDKVAEREQKLVLAIQESVALMQQIGSELKQSSKASTELSRHQQSHLDSLASATEEMVATIAEITHLAHDASEKTNHASQVAKVGQHKVTDTLTSISALSNEINAASAAVTELDRNAARIDEVVTTIRGISEQTNLLALNAAIEAARAGEQGRGFAVVADEVRTLASRTQQATVEIQGMIEALQGNSHSLSKRMTVTVDAAEQGQSLISQVNDEIAQLAQQNQGISDGSIQIATASEEQGVVANSIAENVEGIREQSIEVGALIEASANNVEQLHRQSNAMEQLLKGLKA
ncbi:methyl-accepting chemotaxis protein [Motilimonas sp. KMU-193]|uniref:methyl-accepting chemotaxis protein n=1 Tax=Motilimonas sp. KMU-193 TaxID=3388668 RepID=UPI00396B0C39